MQSNVLEYSTSDKVATIVLSRPQSLNAFNHQLRKDLLTALEAAEADTDIRVIVIKGAGKGFCAGADLGEGLDRPIDEELKKEYKPFLMAIPNSSKVCIAQVHGCAAGIGAALAMVCDIVVMSEDAYIYLAFAAIGLVPDGGLNWHLYRALGSRRAFETIVEGKKLTSTECLTAGICNEIVPNDRLESVVLERAKRIAKGAPLAQSAVKKIFQQLSSLSLSEAINLEADIQQPLTESQDCRNAVEAFFRKEKVEFKGN